MLTVRAVSPIALPSVNMKAIVIDPGERSVSVIDTGATLEEIYRLVGEDSIDTCRPFPGHRFEVAFVGDHSALQFPPLPRFKVSEFGHWLYGRTLVIGADTRGETRSTTLTPEQVYEWIQFDA